MQIRYSVVADGAGGGLRASPSRDGAAGFERLEGKSYVVEDGDILNVRFNV